MSRLDWLTVRADDLQIEPREAAKKLLPLMRSNQLPERDGLEAWLNILLHDCRDLLSRVLPLTPHEYEFLENINSHGEIRPSLITNDVEMQQILKTHPALLWKARNVRNFRLGK